MAAALPTVGQTQNLTMQELLAGPASYLLSQNDSSYSTNVGEHNPYIRLDSLNAIGSLGAILAVSMRVFTQRYLLRGLFLEDYLMLAALAFYICNSGLCFKVVHVGMGKHMWDVTMQDFFTTSKFAWLFVTFYYISILLVKAAILLQFLRIFGVKSMIRSVCCACLVINFAVYVPCVLLNIFGCAPISGAWNRAQESHCINVAVLWTATGFFNIVSDVVLLLIPVPVVLKLKMSTRSKVLVSMVFGTGILACVAAVLRTIYTFRAFRTKDLSFNLLWMGLCCMFEIFVGTVVFFMPIAVIFYTHIRAKIWEPMPANPPVTWEQRYAEDGKGAGVRKAISYEMPSLASFEERELAIERRVTTTIEYMTPIEERDVCLPEKPKAGKSAGDKLFEVYPIFWKPDRSSP